MPVPAEPDDPIYQKLCDVELPASFDDPLDQHPEAVRYYRRLCDISYGDRGTLLLVRCEFSVVQEGEYSWRL